MSFILVIVIVAWFLIWPIVSLAYFKAQSSDAPPPPLPTVPKRIKAEKVRVAPHIEEGKTVVTMRIDGQTYIGTDKDVEHLIRRLKATQMTARTMNEVQALE